MARILARFDFSEHLPSRFMCCVCGVLGVSGYGRVDAHAAFQFKRFVQCRRFERSIFRRVWRDYRARSCITNSCRACRGLRELLVAGAIVEWTFRFLQQFCFAGFCPAIMLFAVYRGLRVAGVVAFCNGFWSRKARLHGSHVCFNIPVLLLFPVVIWLMVCRLQRFVRECAVFVFIYQFCFRSRWGGHLSI